MLPILAQAGPSAVGNAVLIGFTVASGVSTVVSLVSLFATRRELEAMKSEFDRRHLEHASDIQTHRTETKEKHEQIFAKLGGMERGLRGEFRDDMNALRDEIMKAKTDVSSLSATVVALNQSIVAATARLDRIADRRD